MIYHLPGTLILARFEGHPERILVDLFVDETLARRLGRVHRQYKLVVVPTRSRKLPAAAEVVEEMTCEIFPSLIEYPNRQCIVPIRRSVGVLIRYPRRVELEFERNVRGDLFIIGKFSIAAPLTNKIFRLISLSVTC
jgi:hypothetical protein